MNDFAKNLNKAIEAERGRSGISKKVLSRRLGWGGGGANLTRLNARLSGDSGWTTAEIDQVSNALGFSDGWALLDLARQEQRLADAGLAA